MNFKARQMRTWKNSHYGQGLKTSHTRCPQCANILLLIAGMATFIDCLARLHSTNTDKASYVQIDSFLNTLLPYLWVRLQVKVFLVPEKLAVWPLPN